eukprot:g4215.t1
MEKTEALDSLQVTNPMTIEDEQTCLGSLPLSVTGTDLIQTACNDVKVSPEAAAEARRMTMERNEQQPILDAELRQLEPTALTGLPFTTTSGIDIGAPSDASLPSTQVGGASISIAPSTPLPPYVARLMEYEKLKQDPNFEGVKEAIKSHCFSDEWAFTESYSAVPTEEDVQSFLAGVNAPPALHWDERQALRVVMENMEKWWHASYETLQSINDESSQLVGFGIAPVPPTPLPVRLQHHMKLMVLAIENLLKRPEAPPVIREAPAHDPNSEEYWKAVGRQYENNPRQVLQEWMLQHFDKPYPSGDDKKLLADITGMSQVQVSNWFINCRVRTWRPMVEQLAKEIEQDTQRSRLQHSSKYTMFPPGGQPEIP